MTHYRADVQERFRQVAAEMLAQQDTYLVPINKTVVEAAADWSAPLLVRVEPHEDGTADIVFTQVMALGVRTAEGCFAPGDFELVFPVEA